jgi:hypothetical protein
VPSPGCHGSLLIVKVCQILLILLCSKNINYANPKLDANTITMVDTSSCGVDIEGVFVWEIVQVKLTEGEIAQWQITHTNACSTAAVALSSEVAGLVGDMGRLVQWSRLRQ